MRSEPQELEAVGVREGRFIASERAVRGLARQETHLLLAAFGPEAGKQHVDLSTPPG